MSTYQEKIDSAIALLKDHNEAIGCQPAVSTNTGIGDFTPEKGEPNPGYIDPAHFVNCIKACGGTNEDRLKGFSHEDILECLEPKDMKVKPRVLAKELAKIFRGKEEATTTVSRPVSHLRVPTMPPRELVEAFDPSEATSPVGKRLRDIAGDQPFIVYKSGRIIDVVSTFDLLMELKEGFEGRKFYQVGDETKHVYKIGDLPDNYADENPFYVGRPLRPDGTCDQTGRTWDGVPLNVRQLVHLAVETGELLSHQVHDTIDIAKNGNAWNKLRERCPNAILIFNKLQSLGQLPTLKIALGSRKGNGKPFAGGRRVDFAASKDTGVWPK